MDSKKLSALCRDLAEDKKAENVVILDLRDLDGIVDYMVICTGSSDPHLRAIEEEISTKLRDHHGIRPRTVDGSRNSGWMVMDYIDVLVHVMKPESRARYDLEGLWNDVPRAKAGGKKAAKKSSRKRASKKAASSVADGAEPTPE